MADRRDPVVSYHFYIDIESIYQGTFRECSALKMETPVVEYWAGGKSGDTRFAKIPGRVKVADITLKGGLTGPETKKLWDWHQKIVDGQVNQNRQNATIWCFSQDNQPVASWRLFECWPVSVATGSMNAGGNDVLTIELVLAAERLEQVQ
jgi:phage tail-like protein